MAEVVLAVKCVTRTKHAIVVKSASFVFAILLFLHFSASHIPKKPPKIITNKPSKIITNQPPKIITNKLAIIVTNKLSKKTISTTKSTTSTTHIKQFVMSKNLLDVDDDDYIVADVPLEQPSYAANGSLNSGENTRAGEERIHNPAGDSEEIYMGTLNESVYVTILRDLNHIKERMLTVLYPNSIKAMFLPMTMSDIDEEGLEQLNATAAPNTQESVTASPELWAPLIFNIVFSKILANSHDSFAFFFLLNWFLMGILSFHLKIYPKISFLGKISLLFYCFFPILLSSILIKVVLNPFCLDRFFMKSEFFGMHVLGLAIKIFIVCLSTFWAFYSCLAELHVGSDAALSLGSWDLLFSFKNLPVLMTYLFFNWLNVL